jgi:hypothetical protein
MSDKCTDGDVVKLIIAVQQTMTGLQTEYTEEGRFPLIMRAVYGLVMRK